MGQSESQFEYEQKENHKREFHKNGNYRPYKRVYYTKISALTDSIETSENSDGFVVTIPLSLVPGGDLKIIPGDNYIIIQSKDKNQYVNLDWKISPENVIFEITDSLLILKVKK
jgi:hypothetical protein